ncbi:MAG: sialidase family protein [Candidatus Latescibacterota bacterium]
MERTRRPAWQVEVLDAQTAGRGLFPGYACTFTIRDYWDYGCFAPRQGCCLPGHLFVARAAEAAPEVYLRPAIHGQPILYDGATWPIHVAWRARFPRQSVPGARCAHVRPHPGPWEVWYGPQGSGEPGWHVAVLDGGRRREEVVPAGPPGPEGFHEVQVTARERAVVLQLAGQADRCFAHDPYPGPYHLRLGSTLAEETAGEAVTEFREVFANAFPYPFAGVEVPDGPEDVRGEDKAFWSWVCPATPERPRHSEGDLVARRDGSLLLVWSEYCEGVGHDGSPARLSGMVSHDGGRTWGEQHTVAAAEPGCVGNVMSASLLHNGAGSLLLAYLARLSGMPAKGVVLRVSTDDGRTWSPSRLISPPSGNAHLANNASLRRLSSGRLLLACREYVDGIRHPYALLSDDDGATWRPGAHVPDPDLTAPQRRGQNINEPSIAELADGRLLVTCRSVAGGQFFAYSADGGQTWGRPFLSPLRGACSPAALARIPGTDDLLVVFTYGYAGRTPLVSAVSGDGGVTWRHLKRVEQSEYHGYCYTSITFVGERVLLTCMHYPLFTRLQRFTVEPGYTDLRLLSLPQSWFYRDP